MRWFGDNGIISNAQQANVKSGMAVLEEFLQEKYIDVYDSDKNTSDMSELDILRINYPEYFYNPLAYTGLKYILRDGYVYYLLQKESLPTDIQKSIIGGDAGDKSFASYSTFQDVYGVTSDLKVYYCADGVETLIGIDEKLKDDPERVAISSSGSSGLASYLKDSFDWIKTDENGNVLAEGLESLKTLSLENTAVVDLSAIYNFSSLTQLNISNTTINNFKGIENATLLTGIFIDNSIIGDYSSIGNTANLKKIYLTNVTTDEVTKLGNGLKNSNADKIEYFGIYNSPSVTDISSINLISEKTKRTIKYMYLYGNSIETFEIQNGFDSVYELYITRNVNKDWNDTTIKTIKLGEMKNLSYLYARQMYALKSIEFGNMPKLYYVYLYGNYFMNEIKFNSETPELVYFYAHHNNALIELSLNAPKLKELYINECYQLKNIYGVENSKNSLKNIYCESCYELDNINFVQNLSKLTYLNIARSKVTDIYPLKNNTTLETLIIANTKVGIDADISLIGNSYSLLTKTSEIDNIAEFTIKNVFYDVMSNKSNFSTLDARNCLYLGYVSYLSSNKNLKTVYFSGSINISGEEILILKNALTLSANSTFPRTTDSLSSTSTYLNVNSSMILESDFKNIANYPNLERVWFHDVNSPIRIYKDDGITLLNQTEVNKVVNDTLKELTKLKAISIRIKNLSEITFVQTCPNIIYLDMWESSIGSTPNGLQQLNNNCPNIKHILISNVITADFSLIQPLVNKCNTLASYGCEIEGYRGILCWNQASIDTLSKCTDIENAYFNRGSISLYDFSKCTKLKAVNISSGTLGSKYKIKLPTELPKKEDGTVMNYTEYGGYTLEFGAMNFEIDSITGGMSCKKITITNSWSTLNSNAFWSNFDEFSKDNISYLNEFILNSTTDDSQNLIFGDSSDTYSLAVLSNCKNLQKFYWYGKGIREGNFRKINSLSKLSNLTEIYFDKTNIDVIPDLSSLTQLTSLTITNSNLIDISGVSTNVSTSLNTINFNNNSIYDVRPIEKLRYLSTLNLENNSIKNQFTAMTGTVDSVIILNNLKSNYSKNVRLYIKNNYFIDTSGLTWASSI